MLRFVTKSLGFLLWHKCHHNTILRVAPSMPRSLVDQLSISPFSTYLLPCTQWTFSRPAYVALTCNWAVTTKEKMLYYYFLQTTANYCELLRTTANYCKVLSTSWHSTSNHALFPTQNLNDVLTCRVNFSQPRLYMGEGGRIRHVVHDHDSVRVTVVACRHRSLLGVVVVVGLK